VRNRRGVIGLVEFTPDRWPGAQRVEEAVADCVARELGWLGVDDRDEVKGPTSNPVERLTLSLNIEAWTGSSTAAYPPP
jgi:hypothetical protein